MQPLAQGTPWVACGSNVGEISIWDPRRARGAISSRERGEVVAGQVHSITSHKADLSALALHGAAPLVASGSRNQFIKLYDLHALRESGGAARELSTIRYFDGFLGSRIGAVTCLAFHPTRVLLAVGATDSLLSIYASSNDGYQYE